MHMADALIVPAVAATMYAASAVTAGYSIKKVKLENDIKKIPVMGIMAAFVFAAQMINFTIPGTGASGHFSGGLLLAIMLGPYAGFLSMISILTVQCLLFADGGILALGCNIWNMAFYACFIGYFLIYRNMVKKNTKPQWIIFATVLASVISLQLGAFSVTLQTLASGVTELSFVQFLAMMQPIHLAIGVIEGLITSAVVIFIKNARPELLNMGEANNKMEFKKFLVILSIVVVLIGGGLSLTASSNPDGLEWSILKVTGSTEIESDTVNSGAIDQAAEIQNKTALFPNYSFKDSDSKTGTTFSGVLGSVFVAIICIGCAVLFKLFKKTGKTPKEA
ncbi:energy-coupling factor ABC transporter permease [Parasporobacterium paucivorans]|uniref:Cobalt/nickel transport system permease protein n=1 Tax=Parasporobacterium paucivorans DSM 15970 TaxID=1122934 RepID=A0A1M6A820_9FIRM|nr:energy-coupling factor ABC transporter permease [Parasporobacterium paucivorans]SHI32618.1 cobalt/nickel transport system permease protein [Parasporobacterium paucivorans DSM 15970]